jgi:class 3 adenylate cyclase/tetratricopeptide (TPR) repeat protein
MPNVRCPACSAANPDHALFCLACGVRLALACPQCKTRNETAARFCVECGAYLLDGARGERAVATPRIRTPEHLVDKALASRNAIEGERKLITVLFADIRGSLELIVGRDPEVASQILERAIEVMTDSVHRFEGTVNRVLGDGIMALFGAPLAHEDHALRACNAALAMREAMSQQASAVRDAHGVTLQIRVGLNSGEVLVKAIRNDLSMDYDAVGETVHLAARMEQLASPSSIWLTADMFKLVEGLMEGRSLGPISIKGLPAMVEVVELVRAKLRRTWLWVGGRRGLTPFIDRDKERATLGDAAALAAGGKGQVVAVVGEPGCGKSRLLYEFATSATAKGWQVLEGHALSYATDITYYPIIALLKIYFGVEESDDARATRAKIVERLGKDDLLRAAMPACLALCELEVEGQEWRAIEPAGRRQRIRDMITTLLVQVSRTRPLILIIEDAHWIDAETEGVLDRLVDALADAKILLLVSYRPEYRDPWYGKPYYRRLRIDPLGSADATSLLHALIGSDPSTRPLARPLIERTGGNPFFVEESVNALLDDEVLVREGSTCRLVKAMTSVRVPATAHALIAARVDRLSFAEKRLLQSAAVIGRDFPIGLLRSVVDVAEPRMRAILGRLSDAEFLYQTGEFPEPEFMFRHALTHEVCYSGLLQATRVHLHARIVAAIEEQYADRLPGHFERLADHAYRGQVWPKAMLYARRAGTKATQRSANREALRYFEHALEAIGHLTEDRDKDLALVDTYLEMRAPLHRLGQLTRLLDYLRQAEPLASTLGDQARLSQTLYFQSHILWLVGDQAAAIKAGTHARDLAIAIGNGIVALRTDFQLGLCRYVMCDFTRAAEAMRDTLRRIDDPAFKTAYGQQTFMAIMALSYLLRALAETGGFTEALARADEALRLTQILNDPFDRLFTSMAIGYVHHMRGDDDKAIPYLEVALALCHSAEASLMIPPVGSFLGAAYAASGRTEEAIPILEDAVGRAAAVGSLIQQPQRHAMLGAAYLAAGRVSDALGCADSTERLAGELGEPGALAYAERLRGDALSSERPEEALEHYRRAIEIADGYLMGPLAARAQFAIGKLNARRGLVSEAAAELGAALERFRAMGMAPAVEKAEQALSALS